MAGGANDDVDSEISGINVTPLVDITLVLLIIFMVTAKFIVSQSIPLDLPKAASGTDIQTVLSIIMAADGTIQVDGKTVANDDAVLPLARASHEKNPDARALIKADAAVLHGRVIHMLDLLKQGGISKVGFGVSPLPPNSAPTPGAPPPAAPK